MPLWEQHGISTITSENNFKWEIKIWQKKIIDTISNKFRTRSLKHVIRWMWPPFEPQVSPDPPSAEGASFPPCPTDAELGVWTACASRFALLRDNNVLWWLQVHLSLWSRSPVYFTLLYWTLLWLLNAMNTALSNFNEYHEVHIEMYFFIWGSNQ